MIKSFKKSGRLISVLTAAVMLLCTAQLSAPVNAEDASPYSSADNAIYADAVNGNDNNIGSVDSPVKTIGRAQELVREKNDSMTENLYVYLREGTYVLDDTIVFGEEDSGTNGYSVIWTAYDCEKVTVSGGSTITGWTLVDEEKNIYAAPANGIESRDLYVDGERAAIARSDDLVVYEAPTNCKYVYVNYDNLPSSFANIDDLEIIFAAKWKWVINHISQVSENGDYENCFRIKLSDESKDNLKINLTGAAIDESLMAQSYLYLQNAYELLNEPGEFYLDTDADTVYYIPRSGQNMDSAEAVLGKLENLFLFEGDSASPVENITLNNMTFMYTTWLKGNEPDGVQTFQASAICNPNVEWDREWIPSTVSAIYGEYVNNINVKNNAFVLLGNAGIDLASATKNCSITNNTFENIAGGAIIVGDVTLDDHLPTEEFLTENNKITNNRITDAAEVYRSNAGILVGFSSSTTLSCNTLTNLPYTAISCGWGWGYNDFNEGVDFLLGNNSICFNYIENVLNEPALIDGGGIYTLGRQDNSSITSNYIDGVMNEYGGIYLDEGSSGFTVTGNVLTGCVRNFLYKGDYNYIYDNYSTTAQQPDKDETLAIGDELQYRFENNDIWDDCSAAEIKTAAGAKSKEEMQITGLPDVETTAFVYTGEPISPINDLSAIAAGNIKDFTVHFHASGDTEFDSSHLHVEDASDLTSEAILAIAPKEPGEYVMIVSGEDDGSFAYQSYTFVIEEAVPIDTTELDALIRDLEALDLSGYTDESVSALSKALEAAKAVLENSDATQNDLDAAAANLTAAAEALEIAPVEVLWGDIDGSGSVKSIDATLVLQLYANILDESNKSYNKAVADVDGNGVVNSSDATLILQKYARIIDLFPAEQA